MKYLLVVLFAVVMVGCTESVLTETNAPVEVLAAKAPYFNFTTQGAWFLKWNVNTSCVGGDWEFATVKAYDSSNNLIDSWTGSAANGWSHRFRLQPADTYRIAWSLGDWGGPLGCGFLNGEEYFTSPF